MRRRLGFAVVGAVAASAAAAAWGVSRIVGSGDWPAVRPPWPPAEVSAAALTVPPPPPPPACPCIDGYDDEPFDEALEPTEVPATFRLSDAEGIGEPDRAARSAATKAMPLSEIDAERLLASIPPLPAEPVSEPAAPTGTVGASPPPPGERVGPLKFDGAPARPAVEPRAPLTVVRSSPRGEVAVAPELAAVFSEPMAALGATAPETPPVRLVPDVPGQWRWVGSRLLLFLPKPRFPMATEFVAQVREGTRALSGATLESAVEWRFSTPAPSLIEHHPTVGPIRRDAVFFLAFDQAVDPKSVLASVRVEAAGTRRRLRPATSEEIRRDPSVRHLARTSEEGHWVAFRAVDLLPGHSSVRVAVGPGVPSREGPRRGIAQDQWSVETYGPLTVREASCDYEGARRGCAAGAPWSIELSNPIARDSFRESMVRIEPALEGASVKARGSFICIRGLPRPRTRYRVAVDGAVRDEFGGQLGRERSVSFEIGDYGPVLVGPQTDHLVLDPASEPAVTVYSAAVPELRVQLRAVKPADWARYNEHRWEANKLPGRVVLDRVERPASPDGALVATRIPLGPALRNGTGQVIVTATSSNDNVYPRVVTWVQVTRIGVDASWDGRRVLVRTTSLADGKPLRDVSVRVNGAGRVQTNDDGVADMPVGSAESLFVEARLGDDAAFLAVPFTGLDGHEREEPRLRLHVMDDRGLYRPGEDVHVKGWIREVAGYPVRRVAPAHLDSLAYDLVDASGSEVAAGTVPITRHGSFEAVLKLPGTMAVGGASLQLRTPDVAGSGPPVHVHVFRVDEYRRPEVELKLQADAGPLFLNQPARVTASARTFDGAALDGAAMQWWATSLPSAFAPPQWAGFSFTPIVSEAERRPARSESWSGQTDARGAHAVAISALPQDRPYPRRIQLTATVHDVNRQAVSASTSIVVHPAALYVGVRTERAFVSPGDPLGLSFVVTDLEGRAVAGRRVRVSLVRVPGAAGSDEPRPDMRVAERRLTSSDHPVTLRLASLPAGHYRATATVADDQGRSAEADDDAWVGELGVFTAARYDAEAESLRLVADRSEYGPGDLVRLQVLAPFASGEGLLTIRHAGVVMTRHFEAAPSRTTLAFRVSPDWLPGVRVQVDLSGPGRQFASGHLDVPISTDGRRLRVTVAPREPSLEPGGRTVIGLEVADSAGAPVRDAELTCVVVDEAVLAVLGHEFGDPLLTFLARVTPAVMNRSSRMDVGPGDLSPREAALLVSSLGQGVVGGVVGGVPGGILGGTGQVLLRTDLRPLALFAGSLVTDGSGRAEVPVSLPDSVTRFRVFAVASDGGVRFGTAESSIVARLPLVISPSPPRFLRPGDEAEVSVVVRNDGDTPMAVDVGMRATLVRLAAGTGRHLDLPAHGRAEARFPVVASTAGEARFQVVARAGEAADATTFSVPVRQAATTESAAVYGEVADRPVVQPIEVPPHAIAGSAELEITTSATEFAALRDATVSLVTYPYECGEQIASRVLALTTLGERIARLGLGSVDLLALRGTVERDLLRLGSLQQPDGGFAFWPRGESAPEVTVHVAHALATARASHPALAQPMVDRVLPYLRAVETKVSLDDGEVARLAIGAEALYVRSLLGDKDSPKARQMARWAKGPRPAEAEAWLLAALAEDADSRAEAVKLRAALEAHITETGSVAHVATRYEDREQRVLLASEERTDAVVLEALLRAAPESDLIPKLTAGLLAARRKGHWSTTQANAWAIVALDHAFRTREATPPDFTATAWLGDRTLSSAKFRGFDGRSRTTTVRLSEPGSESSDVTLAREGRGVLHYRLGLRYGIDPVLSPPVDRGFIVERQFEALENPADVRRAADGSWHIRAGARIRVRIVVVATVRRDHVALVSSLPAGLEPLNPFFRNSPPPRPLRGAWTWWWDRVEIRDDRVQLFASSLPEGIWTFTCEAVATTPGRFLAGPPKVEEMYSDDVFGRGAADRVVID
ncbi:MAG: alpha-2-macroglobulin family protein [Vicinamibacteria bacterium]